LANALVNRASAPDGGVRGKSRTHPFCNQFTFRDMTLSDTSCIEVPVKTRPRLPKGSLHKLQVTSNQLQIKSYENRFGNTSSNIVLTVPHVSIIQVELKEAKVTSGQSWCTIAYRNESGKEVRLKFCALNSGGSFHNQLTEVVATALEELRWNQDVLPYQPFAIPLNPPKSVTKFFYGMSLFAGAMLLGGLRDGWGFLFFMGTFLFFPSLIAVGIDYVRLNTAWHPILKIVSYASIFLLGFIMMVTAFAFMDARDLFG